MKTKHLKFTVCFIIIMIASCNEPETVVTDIIHPDGSVTRKIEMKNTENKFKISSIQVPFDTTWSVRDSLEINTKGDTTWVKRAEKYFSDVAELNMSYKADSGANKAISRSTEFYKKFRWFNTVYRFAEIIDKKLEYGYPASDFLNQQEMEWFYSPENVTDEKRNGPDSLKYKALDDSVINKTEKWGIRCLASEWIGEFSQLAGNRATGRVLYDSLKAHENDFVTLEETNNEKFDSLWSNGILLAQFIGRDNAEKYKTEVDSAIKIVTDKFFVDFTNYTQRIIMPGETIGTNGFRDSSGVLLWQVKSDYFLSSDYKMWAESRITNLWVWIVSGVFLLFVLAGIIYQKMKKG
jgi:hypothetical protein